MAFSVLPCGSGFCHTHLLEPTLTALSDFGNIAQAAIPITSSGYLKILLIFATLPCLHQYSKQSFDNCDYVQGRSALHLQWHRRAEFVWNPNAEKRLAPIITVD